MDFVIEMLVRDAASLVRGDHDPGVYARMMDVIRMTNIDPDAWDAILMRLRDGERDFQTLAANADDGSKQLLEMVLDVLAGDTDRLAAPEAASGLAEILAGFEPLLSRIAHIARGEAAPKVWMMTRADLDGMERTGSKFPGAVRRIWNGDRDSERLTRDLNVLDAMMVQRVLALLEGSES